MPEVRDERDECVQRIIRTLEDKKGIEKVHVVPKDGKEKARLCFHYDPYFISISKVEELAKNAGAEITRRYGHLLIETTGVREPRHARIIQAGIKEQKGIQTVSVSGTGFIQLEFDKEATSAETVIEQIKKAGLKIDNVENSHLHAPKETAEAKEKQRIADISEMRDMFSTYAKAAPNRDQVIEELNRIERLNYEDAKKVFDDRTYWLYQ